MNDDRNVRRPGVGSKQPANVPAAHVGKTYIEQNGINFGCNSEIEALLAGGRMEGIEARDGQKFGEPFGEGFLIVDDENSGQRHDRLRGNKLFYDIRLIGSGRNFRASMQR